jgi:hypothetical protein
MEIEGWRQIARRERSQFVIVAGARDRRRGVPIPSRPILVLGRSLALGRGPSRSCGDPEIPDWPGFLTVESVLEVRGTSLEGVELGLRKQPSFGREVRGLVHAAARQVANAASADYPAIRPIRLTGVYDRLGQSVRPFGCGAPPLAFAAAAHLLAQAFA